MFCQINQEFLNPQNIDQQFESFSTIVSIVGEDLLKGFTRCFICNFLIKVISEKTMCSKGFISNLRDNFK